MNYKKIYSQAIKTLLKDQPLRMYIGEDSGKDGLLFDNSCLCFLPKNKNIFALKACELLDRVDQLLPKGELSAVLLTDVVVNKKTKACLLKMASGEDYTHFICDTFLGYFDRDAEVKVNPKIETSPFYIYENGELAGIIAPIRQR